MLALTYVSQGKIDFSELALYELADKAQLFNESVGISGYLYYEKGHFIQYIEGPEKEIRALMERIQGDERHEVVTVVYDDTLEQKRFEGWSMKLFAPNEWINIRLENIWRDILLRQQHRISETIESQLWRIVEKIAQHRG